MDTNMTTKGQEREALEKIRAIVEALGQDSYIGTALEVIEILRGRVYVRGSIKDIREAK